MKKQTKGWLITAVALIVAGCLLFGGVMTVFSWDFTVLSTRSLVTKECLISESFHSIYIDTSTANVELVLSDAAAVTCREWENETHTVSVVDGVLTIAETDTRKWYQHIGITVGSPSVTVYVPRVRGTMGNLTVKASTGTVTVPDNLAFENVDITLSTGSITCEADAAFIDLRTSTGAVTVNNVIADKVNVSVSTGKTSLNNVRCHVFTTTGDTGRVTLSDVIATRRMGIRRTTGDVVFDRCDTAVLNVTTDTGDVTGTMLTDKPIKVTTSTGDVEVPESDENGASTIDTSTGDVNIRVAE